MDWLEQKKHHHRPKRRAPLKPDFSVRKKWNKKTALYTLFYHTHLYKGNIIPREISNKEQEHTITRNYIENYTLNGYHCAVQMLWDFFPEEIKQQQIQQYVNNFLSPYNIEYPIPYTKDILNFLMQNKQFLHDVLAENIQEILQTIRAPHHDRNYPETTIKLEQLYEKFTIDKTIHNPAPLKNFKSFQYYKLYHYIDNLIFAEFLSQVLWIAGTNELLIKDKYYKIYAASIQDDFYHKTDLILQDEQGKLIGLDITISHTKKSWRIDYSTKHLQEIFVANHRAIKSQFEVFYVEFTQSLYGAHAQPILDLSYNDQDKAIIENRISNIIQEQESIAVDQSLNTDNNAQLDQ